MITDARALRQRFIPQELVHRDGEVDVLTNALEPLAKGDIGEDLLITGPSGVGKTSTTKHVLNDLERQTLDIETAYVNCISANSPTGALATLVRDTGRSAPLDPRGGIQANLVESLRQLDGTLVAVLDEADVLEDKGLIHTLYELPHVTLVLITVTADDLFMNADIRVTNRLRSFHPLEFDAYTHQELMDILAHRADVGLHPNALGDGVLNEMADIAAGNARLGIALLRRAAKRCQTMRQPTITTDTITAVHGSARKEIASRYVDKLGTDQRLLYEIIAEHETIEPEPLYQTYEDRASDPNARRTLRNYLAAMRRENLIEKTGAGPTTRYRTTT
ncbi:Cdc6/Cdc18 family protein [Halorubellus sp. PRR65]|uniref:Cdc6/Cdc18 family protein n=1 Tax=Halorubellus sp. PRR65 TaxID=3098148 RepID=UPI002B263ED1|nr:Cdc6/Cdc18 family protein [Halorubellus sp. PRR65]